MMIRISSSKTSKRTMIEAPKNNERVPPKVLIILMKVHCECSITWVTSMPPKNISTYLKTNKFCHAFIWICIFSFHLGVHI